MSPRGSSFAEVVYSILKESGSRLHVDDIARIGLEKGLLTTRSENLANSLQATLYKYIHRGGNALGITRLGNNYFGLAEWGGSEAELTQLPAIRRHRTLASPSPSVPTGITFEKLERIRSVMPESEFQRDWGELHAHVLAVERAKAISHIPDRVLLNVTRTAVNRIQQFLQGNSSEVPRSEVVCDWIHLCYTLELFPEGATLWQYVNKDEVNSWQYERTMKISATCRSRLIP